MKIISWQDQIVSLEKVREVVALTSSKNNYTIRVNYTDNNYTCIRDLSATIKDVLMNDIKIVLEKA